MAAKQDDDFCWGTQYSKSPCLSMFEYLKTVDKISNRWNSGKPKHTHRMWFRGQSSSDWGLIPKLYRDECSKLDESELRLAFQSNALQLVSGPAKLSKWNWYFLMQHYEVPTRLLDWTLNPLIALYFALSEFDEKSHLTPCVWVFDAWHWNSSHIHGLKGPALPGWSEAQPYLHNLEDSFNGEESYEKWPIAIEPLYINARLTKQASRFLLFGRRPPKKNQSKISAVVDLREIVSNYRQENAKDEKAARLCRVDVSRECRDVIMRELDKIDINRKTIYPDLFGLGRYLAKEWSKYQ